MRWIDGVGEPVFIDMADFHFRHKAAASALQPRLQAYIEFLAAVMYQSLETFQLVPIGFAPGISCTENTRNPVVRKMKGFLAAKP